MERSGVVATIVCDTTGNTVRQGYRYTCLAIGGGISVGSLSFKFAAQSQSNSRRASLRVPDWPTKAHLTMMYQPWCSYPRYFLRPRKATQHARISLCPCLGGRFGYFLFFFCSGRGRGSPRRQEWGGGGSVFN